MSLSQDETQAYAHPTGDRGMTDWRFGSILGLVAIIALMELPGFFQGALLYFWPSLLLLSTLLLFLEVIRREGLLIWHYLLSEGGKATGLLAIAGLAELGSLVFDLTVLKMIWPLALLYLARKFHAGAGRERLVGGSLMLASAARFIAIASGIYKGTVGFAWIALLMFASFLLLTRQSIVDSEPD